MITKAQKTAWLAALRSGQYRQGNGYLYSSCNDCFCATGLGLHVCFNIPDHLLNYCGTFSKIGMGLQDVLRTESLAQEIRNWLTKNDENEIINMNDKDISFLEIADWIEDNINPDN